MFSDPVVGEDFFGRQDIIDLLVKRVDALKSGYRQNVAIIGHQQLGKTSILRQFLHVYKDPQILPVYVEIKIQALDYFVDQFIRALLYQVVSRFETVEPMEPLSTLVPRAVSRIPKTVARVEEIILLLKQRHAEEAYTKLFELTSIVKQEIGLSCVVILDEFHRLGEFGIRNPFQDFGKRIMVQKDTMYLLASSAFTASRKILAEKLSLLFGNFERIYLQNFDFETAFAYVEKKIAPIGVSESLRTFLVAFTDGHPFFLQTLIARLRELSRSKHETEVSTRSVAEAVLKLLYESQGVLNMYFLRLISPWTQTQSRGSQILILSQMAKGVNKLKELSLSVNRSQKETQRQLEELMASELILKTGVFHRFHNKLFRFWLAEVYEKKELSLLGPSAKAEDFLLRVEELIAEHDQLLSLCNADRVAQLLRRFNNELVEFGEKRRILPHFTEILQSDPNADTPKGSSRTLIARGHGRCWFCRVVEEKATEEEVLRLAEGSQIVGEKSPTRVLLALRGVEDNARLLAKEKRILTLGLSRINLLMELYGRSPIIPSQAPRPERCD